MRILKAVAAGLAGLLLIIAPPYLLVRFIGNPYPPEGIDLAAPLTDNAILGVLAVLVWVLWAQLTVSLLVELYAAVLDRPVDVRLPVFGFQQDLARVLVGAVIAATVAAPLGAGLFTSATADPGASGADTTTAVTDQHNHSNDDRRDTQARYATPGGDDSAGEQTPAPKTAQSRTQDQHRMVTVAVSRGDTLWSLAETYLGDGARWTEIAASNDGRTMADGTLFRSADQIRPGWQLQVPGLTEAPANETTANATEKYQVKAGDTLSEIAQDQLGDPQSYPAIFTVSQRIPQPGGDALTNPDHIEPGWTLAVPSGRGDHSESDPKQEQNPDSAIAERPETTPTPADENPAQGGDVEQRDGEQEHRLEQDQQQDQQQDRETQPEQRQTPVVPTLPTETPTTAQNTETGAGEASADADEEADEEASWPVRTVGGVGVLLAGMLIALLGRRRLGQRRQRKPGQRVPMPVEPGTEKVETEVRAVADEVGVEFVDVALRSLGAHVAAGLVLPDLQAARMTSTQLDLYLADEPATDLPAPWRATADPKVWLLAAGDLEHLGQPAGQEPTASPWPALVSVGHDVEQGVVMLNLNHTAGLPVRGEYYLTRQVLTALVVELGTAPWSEDALDLTVIGSLVELADVLPPGRLRYVPTAHNVRFTPGRQHVVVAMSPLVDEEIEQLNSKGAVVVTQATPTGEGAAPDNASWGLDLVDADTAALAPIGLQITPQRVDNITYASILDMLSMSLEEPYTPVGGEDHDPVVPFSRRHEERPTSTPGSDVATHPTINALTDSYGKTDAAPHGAESSTSDHQVHAHSVPQGTDHQHSDTQLVLVRAAAPAPESRTDSVAKAGDEQEQLQAGDKQLEETTTSAPVVGTEHPTIRLLGPVVDIVGASTQAPTSESHLKVCTRIATYLVLNPNATRAALVEAIWGGRRVKDNTVDSRISQLRKWLGDGPDGQPYLPRRGLRFAEAVTTDWQLFKDLVGADPSRAATDALAAACSLVRGRPLEGEQSKHYGFAEYLTQDIIDSLTDATYELARRRYMAGEWLTAGQDATLGIRVDPANERLWRLRIHAAHSAGNAAGVTEAIDRMNARITELGFDLEPETVELLDAIQRHDDDTIRQAREGL